MSKVDLTTLSVDELKEALRIKEQEATAEAAERRATHEARKADIVARHVKEAVKLNEMIADFKRRCMAELFEFRQELSEYGGLSKRSKGGYQIRHPETQAMVVLSHNRVAEYDERASLAEDLIRDFLNDSVKKRSLQDFNTINVLLEKNKKGEFTPARVASFLKIRDNYQDERWQKAMQLFEESFQVRDIAYNVEFYQKDSMGKDEIVKLSFSSISVDDAEEEDNSSEE
jgi:hypothetical protein